MKRICWRSFKVPMQLEPRSPQQIEITTTYSKIYSKTSSWDSLISIPSFYLRSSLGYISSLSLSNRTERVHVAGGFPLLTLRVNMNVDSHDDYLPINIIIARTDMYVCMWWQYLSTLFRRVAAPSRPPSQEIGAFFKVCAVIGPVAVIHFCPIVWEGVINSFVGWLLWLVT